MNDTQVSTVVRRLEAVIDVLLPPRIRAERTEDARRSRLAVSFAVAIVFFRALAFVAQWATGNRLGAWLSVYFVATNCLALVAVRLTGRVALTVHAVLGANVAGIFASALLLRGAGLNGATIALVFIPLFATVLLGPRAAAAWTAISVAVGAAIGLSGEARLITDTLPIEKRVLTDHIAMAVATLVLFVASALYEQRRLAALRQVATLAEEKRTVELAHLRARSDAQLAEAAGLAAVARIAAAAAHEINNPLSVVGHNIQFVDELLPPDAAVELHAALKDAASGVERIRRIVAEMRVLDEGVGPVSLEAAVTSAQTLAEAHTRGVAQVRVASEPVPLVVANESRLIQVLVSLLAASAYAIERGPGEDREISVDVRSAPDAVIVEVRDRGAEHWGEQTRRESTMCRNIVQSFGGTLTSEANATGTSRASRSSRRPESNWGGLHRSPRRSLPRKTREAP
jgi:signal transduction histidine kinase